MDIFWYFLAPHILKAKLRAKFVTLQGWTQMVVLKIQQLFPENHACSPWANRLYLETLNIYTGRCVTLVCYTCIGWSSLKSLNIQTVSQFYFGFSDCFSGSKLYCSRRLQFCQNCFKLSSEFCLFGHWSWNCIPCHVHHCYGHGFHFFKCPLITHSFSHKNCQSPSKCVSHLLTYRFIIFPKQFVVVLLELLLLSTSYFLWGGCMNGC